MKISSYTTTRNAKSMGYPYLESIASMLSFSDEVVVYDNNSSDGTAESIAKLSEKDNRVLLFKEEGLLFEDDPRFARKFDGELKAKSRAKCSGDVLFQFDCDEIVDSRDSGKIIDCCSDVLSSASNSVFCIPIVEFWGSAGKIRCDVPFFKPRISVNSPSITQGVPFDSISIDSSGDKYSKSSDSCDYIFSSTLKRVPHDYSFVNKLFENARASFFSGTMDKESFIRFFKAFLLKASGKNLPLVYHYSWFDMERKIRNYRDYWGRFWSSMFDEKASEQNNFFGKPWAEVSEEEIKAMAAKISSDTAGWIFHKPIDFEKASRFPFVFCEEVGIAHPPEASSWISDSR